MKVCNHCGGLQRTEPHEMIAGTPCFCFYRIGEARGAEGLPGLQPRQWSEADIRRIVGEELARAKREGG